MRERRRGSVPVTRGAGEVGPVVGLAPRPHELSRLGIFGSVARRAGPQVAEATVVPAVLFTSCLAALGTLAAYLAALGWSYVALVRRLARRRGVPPVLVLGVLSITVRTVVAIVSRSSFLYFLQPILGTVAMGGAFLVSIAIGRPLVGRLADQFWPMTPEVACRPAVVRLFRRLTYVWAGANMASAALTTALLLWLPLTAFVAVKQVAGMALTAAAVFLTISLSLATAKREGLAFVAPGPQRAGPADGWPASAPAC